MQIEKNLRNRITIPFGDEEVEATPSEAISWYGKQLEQQGKVEKHEQELVQNNLKMYADQIRSRLITYGGNEGESIQAMFNKNGSGYLRMQKIANMTPGEANQAGISPQEILKAKKDKYFVDTQIMHTKYPTGKIPTISIPEEERKKFPPGRPMLFADREGATLFLVPEGDNARILNIVPPGLSPDEWRTEVGKLADLYRME